MKNARILLRNTIAISAAMGLLIWLSDQFWLPSPKPNTANLPSAEAFSDNHHNLTSANSSVLAAEQISVIATSPHRVCFDRPLAYWLDLPFATNLITQDPHIESAPVTNPEMSQDTLNALNCINQYLRQTKGNNSENNKSEDKTDQARLNDNTPATLVQSLSADQQSQLAILLALVPSEFDYWQLSSLLANSKHPLLDQVYSLFAQTELQLMPLHCQHRTEQCETSYITIKQHTLQQIAAHTIAHFPDAIIHLLYRNQYQQLNHLVVQSLLTTAHEIPLPQLWPALVSAAMPETALLEQIIEHYLKLNRTNTLYYLADYFRFHTEQPMRQPSHLPHAIATLLAWEMDQLHYLSPEDYRADSELVIQGVSAMLMHDPSRVFNRLAQMPSAPLRDKILASVVQSRGFFNLEKDRILALLSQQPQALAQQLANAYVLQFAHLPRSEYLQTIEQFADFVTLTETL